MEFLLSHWHCILPATGLIIGGFLMSRDKGKDKNAKKDSHDSNFSNNDA